MFTLFLSLSLTHTHTHTHRVTRMQRGAPSCLHSLHKDWRTLPRSPTVACPTGARRCDCRLLQQYFDAAARATVTIVRVLIRLLRAALRVPVEPASLRTQTQASTLFHFNKNCRVTILFSQAELGDASEYANVLRGRCDRLL